MDRDRLLEALRAQGWSQSDLARAVGITPGAVHQLVKGTTGKTKYLPEIARALGVSVHWLNGSSAQSALERAPEVDFVQLVELDVGYGMGGGTFVDEVEEGQQLRVFDPTWVRQITRSPPEMLFAARGIGDSMNPTLHDDDTLIFDRAQRTLSQQDRIWALTYGELGMIKRIRRRPTGTLVLMSDNPAISDVEATSDEVHIVGRLVWIGRKA